MRFAIQSLGQLSLDFILVAAIAVASAAAVSGAASAQECALKTDRVQGATSYRQRGDRCEGSFRDPVASRINLRVVAYHLNRPDFDMKKLDKVALNVRGHGVGTTLRVTSLRPRDNYQMDTDQLDANGGFSWPLKIIQGLPNPIGAYNLAAIACTDRCSGDRSGSMKLMPVGFNQSAPGGSRAVLLVMADAELKELRATLKVGGRVVMENAPVGGRYIPAGREQVIAIDPSLTGVGTISLSALAADGMSRDYYEAKIVLPGPAR